MCGRCMALRLHQTSNFKKATARIIRKIEETNWSPRFLQPLVDCSPTDDGDRSKRLPVSEPDGRALTLDETDDRRKPTRGPFPRRVESCLNQAHPGVVTAYSTSEFPQGVW